MLANLLVLLVASPGASLAIKHQTIIHRAQKALHPAWGGDGTEDIIMNIFQQHNKK